jgi:pSer/pThr/pTyr-binding forkhead associated (FHA) protein
MAPRTVGSRRRQRGHDVNPRDDDPNFREAPAETTADFGDHFLDELDDGSTATRGAETAEELPRGSALLVVKRGPNAGSRFLLDQPVTSAGRHPDSDILLDDVTVSRRHAEFRLDEDGNWVVADVGSLNGIYVNRQPVDSTVLVNNDEVQIGRFRLVFFTGAATWASPA